MSTQTPVHVTAVSFTNDFEVVPRRIEFDGISYDLGDDYKKVSINDQDGLATFFDVSDGSKHFRLRHDEGLFGWWLMEAR